MQHGGDGAHDPTEPGHAGGAQGGPTGPDESIQGTRRRDGGFFLNFLHYIHDKI